MALNKKFFPKVSAAAADVFTPSEHFETVTYTGNGSTQRIGGYINRGAVFNGSSSYINLGNASSLVSTDFTFSAWVKTTSTSTIFLISSAVNPYYSKIGVRSEGDGRLRCVYGNYTSNEGNFYSTFNTINNGNWHHVVYFINQTTAKLYINGSLDTTHTLTVTPTINGNLEVGSLYYTGTSLRSSYWDGAIDQVRIFDKELSSSEVTTLYGETHASTTISTTDIFSDDSGVALYQLDGNANDTGGVSGKFGSAAIFNGTNSYIQVGTGLDFNSSDCAISFWIKFNDSTVASQTTAIATNGGSGFYEFGQSGSTVYWIWCTQNFGSFTTPSTGVWHHIVMTVTGNTSTIYVDGVSTDTDTSTFTSADSGLTLGAKRDTLSRYFNGSLDEIRIYSDALTSTEVGYLYNNTTASIPTDNLEAYYKLDGDARDEQQLYDGTASNVTYAYDGTATNVTYQEATNFSPDLVWIKSRSETGHHSLFDSVRGIYQYLTPSQSGAEIDRTSNSAGVTAFDSNGFSVNDPGGAGENYYVNQDNVTYAAWCWKAGGAAVSNTDGTITSQVSANTEAGFSIATYAGNSTQNATIGHGLTSPKLTIVKNIDQPDAWFVGSTLLGTNEFLELNESYAKTTNSDLNYQILNTTFKTTSSSPHDMINQSGENYVMYTFADVAGYQKVGSYTGTGAAGNTVVTGFEPAFVMVKRTDSTGVWVMLDNKRNLTNPRNSSLYANTSAQEDTGSTSGFYPINFYENGFEPIQNTGDYNASGGTYIFMAFAADPDTTTPTVENSFDVVTYTGNGSTQEIATDFKPDLVWVKIRNLAYDHNITDSIRGTDKQVRPNRDIAEVTNSTGVTSFDSNGFTVGTGGDWNGNGNSYVAWVWKAGDHDDNLPQINTEGSIDSVVSVNAAAGFSIVKYTGNGTSGSTIGHGLSDTPQMMISKRTDSGDNWNVYTEATGNTGILYLNLTDAFTTVSNRFNNTSPTSTVFTVGNSPAINVSGGEYIAYCFHSVSGYQKVGSYSGSNSDLQVDTGFQPRFLMLKNIDASGRPWVMIDSLRTGYLEADSSAVEADTISNYVTFNSQGFLLVGGTGSYMNESGWDFLYLAIK